MFLKKLSFCATAISFLCGATFAFGAPKNTPFTNSYLDTLRNSGVHVDFKAFDHVSAYDVFRIVNGRKVTLKSGVSLREALGSIDGPAAEQEVKFELSKIDTKIRNPYSIAETECTSRQMYELLQAITAISTTNRDKFKQMDSLEINFQMNANYKATTITKTENKVILTYSLRNDAIRFTGGCELVPAPEIANFLNSDSKSMSAKAVADEKMKQVEGVAHEGSEQHAPASASQAK